MSDTSSGQVCDRCRRRKIRCAGENQKCAPCTAAGAVCVRTTQLKRNRKRKSYYQAQDALPPTTDLSCGPSLQETATLLSSIATDVTPTPAIQAPYSSSTVASVSTPVNSIVSNSIQVPTQHSRSAPLDKAKENTDPVIGHMGRLVSNDQQIAMFAGSSTGTHFITQSEQQLQMQGLHQHAFPSAAYSLHLHSLWGSSIRQPAPNMFNELVRSLPNNSETILSAAIDRCTPLYPIVHKPSTMQAFRALGESSQAPNISVLYQILGLLALGSLGEGAICSRSHRHYMCASESYYEMSTILFTHILDRPCLQTLQGLQITQLYLQLTSRYTLASHISGVATRMAQNLGLHRHSNRFKFDPLETELRRRVWWCQYTLDTLSSAYHGTPRLVREQDVDTDPSTPIDHELLSRSHISFPLPGEGSQVDGALLLFKLAKIIGETLEKLYTTTRRRGAVSKIARLQAELDAWERSLTSELGRRSPDPETGEPDPDIHHTATEQSFHVQFLKAAHCVATVQVHRPALAFTRPHKQFKPSLEACSRASANLIRLVVESFKTLNFSSTLGPNTTSRVEALSIILLYPNGAHMLWQAGLTILFAHWQGHPLPATYGDEAILLLDCSSSLRSLGAMTDDAGGDLEQCAQVLDTLCSKTFSMSQGPGPAVGVEALQWNVWDWPMASALELANTLDVIPFDLELSKWSPSLSLPDAAMPE